MRSESNFVGKNENFDYAMGDLLMHAEQASSDPFSQTNAYMPNPISQITNHNNFYKRSGFTV